MNSDEIIKGTYKPDDVTLLLKDVTDLVTPVTTEEKERLIQHGPYKRATPKIGRNDKCPCGSGKKYKNCCGRTAS